MAVHHEARFTCLEKNRQPTLEVAQEEVATPKACTPTGQELMPRVTTREYSIDSGSIAGSSCTGMTTSGFAEVDDQLERRPVAILQTAHLMRSFRRNPLGGFKSLCSHQSFTSQGNRRQNLELAPRAVSTVNVLDWLIEHWLIARWVIFAVVAGSVWGMLTTILADDSTLREPLLQMDGSASVVAWALAC